MDSLIYGFMDHELTNKRIHRLMDSLAHGLTHLRIHRFTDSRIYRFADLRIHKLWIHGFKVSRTHRFTDLRIHGLVGLMDSWIYGLTVHGFKNGSQIQDALSREFTESQIYGFRIHRLMNSGTCEIQIHGLFEFIIIFI